MTNKLVGATLACLFSLSALLQPSHIQALPLSVDNATALLQKSLEATSLRTAKQSFHLTSTFTYKANTPNLTGHFELLFSAPDRYRMNLTVGTISETQILIGDKLYISRSSPKFSPEVWRVAEFLWSPGAGLQTPPKVIVGRATTYPAVKVSEDCEEESDALRRRKACFDSSQQIISFTIRDNGGSRLSQDAVSLSDFHSLGASRYPGHLTKKSAWDTIDATVDSFVVASDFDENTFTPPANSVPRDWCPLPQAITPPAPVFHVIEGALYVYYVLVGTNGRVKKFSFINESLGNPRQSLEGKPYPILACSGKPVEYEMVVITNSY